MTLVGLATAVAALAIAASYAMPAHSAVCWDVAWTAAASAALVGMLLAQYLDNACKYAEFDSTQEGFGRPKAQADLQDMFRCCCTHDVILTVICAL